MKAFDYSKKIESEIIQMQKLKELVAWSYENHK